MKLLIGELQAVDGEVLRANKLKVATYSQHFEERLPLDLTATKYIMDEFGIDQAEARRTLGRFGISGKIQMNKIETLSGGQKARVMLCNVALQKPDILFLDEPTNHLDIQSIEALAKGLRDFKGGVLLITHNQRLIGASCDRIWCIEGNEKVTLFNGEFKDYQNKLLESLSWTDEGDEEETAEDATNV